MKETYGLTAANRPEISIDPAAVPEHLQDLIPTAEKWGVGDDIEETASAEQKQEFQSRLKGRTEAVSAWLDSFGSEDMTEEAGHFMYMLSALEEMGIGPAR